MELWRCGGLEVWRCEGERLSFIDVFFLCSEIQTVSVSLPGTWVTMNLSLPENKKSKCQHCGRGGSICSSNDKQKNTWTYLEWDICCVLIPKTVVAGERYLLNLSFLGFCEIDFIHGRG